MRIPVGIYADFNSIVSREMRWKSVADFLLEAGKEKLDRWKAEGHVLPAEPGPAGVVEEVRREAQTRTRTRVPPE